MEEKTVEFKMDVSDEDIKRKVMKAVWMFSGVTFVDIITKGILNVKGIFDNIEMGRKLHEIDDSVDINIPESVHEHSYLIPPKLKFQFRVLDEGMKRDAMEVIWKFSEVTAVQVKGDDAQLEVAGGDFNKIAMATKIKNIDESVNVIIMPEPDVLPPKTKPHNAQILPTIRYQLSVCLRLVVDKDFTINNDDYETLDNVEARDDVVEQVTKDVEVAVRRSTRQPKPIKKYAA